jgi:hypothetical protein
MYYIPVLIRHLDTFIVKEWNIDWEATKEA